MLSIGPTICTQAANRSSTRAVAMRRASSPLPTVVTTWMYSPGISTLPLPLGRRECPEYPCRTKIRPPLRAQLPDLPDLHGILEENQRHRLDGLTMRTQIRQTQQDRSQ